MEIPDHHALLQLHATGGAVAAKQRLLDRHGDAARALQAGTVAWRAAGLTEAQVGALRSAAAPTAACDWLQASEARRVLGWHAPDYPAMLRHIGSPPLAVFVEGQLDLLWLPTLAIVGTRNPSAAGQQHARRFARHLAGCGMVIASGLASGIDACAHEAALSVPAGRTVAVLGTGPDIAYPASNSALLQRIAAEGLLLSEHAPGTPPRRQHFPQRNRLLAGLSDAVLVVEAAERSGALITARMALDAGREVFALPGSIDNPMARGCHRLLREGATLVETPDELADLLLPSLHARRQHLLAAATPPVEPSAASPSISAAGSLALPFDGDDHHRLWQCLGTDPMCMDDLAQHTGLTPPELSSILLLMELDGRVVVEHGRWSRRQSG